MHRVYELCVRRPGLRRQATGPRAPTTTSAPPEEAAMTNHADEPTGMRSADIPDGFARLPDIGTCPVCRAQGRLTKDGGMRQHWQRGWAKRDGHPPCAGSGQAPAALNEARVTRWRARARYGDDAA